MIANNANIKQPLSFDTKYYGVFAVNRKDPNDILGYVENSFSMGWSRYFVNIWPASSKKQVDEATDRWFSDSIMWHKPDEEFFEWFKKSYSRLYIEGMTAAEARKAYWQEIWETRADLYLAQRVWNYVNEGGYVPVGYDRKVFRINAKNCPVLVDMRYRYLYDTKQTKVWDKWRWRNAPFMVKACNPGKTWETLAPTLNHIFSLKTLQLKDPKLEEQPNHNIPHNKRDKRSFKTDDFKLTRSQRKIAEKQRNNSYLKAAEKRSPRVVKALPERAEDKI